MQSLKSYRIYITTIHFHGVERMKVFIAVDLEGVAGYVRWDPADRQREREFVTADANAAIAGAFDGGATEVLVTEAHGNMRNIIPEKLDPRAVFLSGEPKSQDHMAGIDGSFQAAMLVGYHSKAGTRNGVMAHTFRGFIYSLSFNGTEIGEIGTDAAIAGNYGVPVVLVAGDAAACDEARSLLGNVEVVAVKEGISRYGAKCRSLEESRHLIQEGAKRAMGRIPGVSPFTLNPPVQAEVTFIDPTFADAVSYLPFVNRVDGRTIRFVEGNFLKAFEVTIALFRLAGSYQ
jgi:D-amino peptidase